MTRNAVENASMEGRSKDGSKREEGGFRGDAEDIKTVGVSVREEYEGFREEYEGFREEYEA